MFDESQSVLNFFGALTVGILQEVLGLLLISGLLHRSPYLSELLKYEN